MADRFWHLRDIGVPRAWEQVFGVKIDPAKPDWKTVEGLDWGTVRVAHLDHGYTRHPATRRAVKPELGWNFMEHQQDARDPMDYDEGLVGFRGHGTRTGSVIAGLDPDFGYLGIAPGVPLVPYRVTNRSVLELPDNGPEVSECENIAQAIRAAIDRKCQVVSISLGAVFGHKPMGVAIGHAYQNGVIVVAAAGQVLSKLVYPGKYRQTIAAGGFGTKFEAYQRYEGTDAQPDIWAPGMNVHRAASVAPDKDPHDHIYGVGDGTSYATAVIAGLAALFLRKYRTRLETYQGWRRVELFRALLARGSRTVDGDTALRGVQFGAVLADGFPPWPTPKALGKARIKAASMRF